MKRSIEYLLPRHFERGVRLSEDVMAAVEALRRLSSDDCERVCALVVGRHRLEAWAGGKRRSSADMGRLPGLDHATTWIDDDNHYLVSEPYNLSTHEIRELGQMVEDGADIHITAMDSWHFPGRTMSVRLTRGRK